MNILMVGASGKFASLVVPELKERGATVRALIRSQDKETEAREHGADEVAIGDLNDEASLSKAADGAEGIFHINPAFARNESELGISMVNAAKAAGVRKFVFSGVIHPSISKMTNHRSKGPVEEALYESGLNFTVLQPTMFMQTMEASWQGIVAEGRFSLPYSVHAKACYVDYRDVAEAAAIGLLSDKLDYGTFELCAAGMFDRVEVAAIMSKALGRTVEAGQSTFEEWVGKAKIPDGPLKDGMKAMYADYDRYGFPGGNALVLRAILDREPRTLENFFTELAQA